jgi:alkaline phosphatase D
MDRRTFEHALTHPVSRRRLLGVGLAVGAAAVSLPGSPTRAMDGAPFHQRLVRPQFAGTPFTLGVASGDPLPDGIVLWTRLASDPLNGGGMTDVSVAVRWELAADEGFTKIIQSGSETATAALAHSVHADVAGLQPSTVYYYRFKAGDEISPTGRTKTAPAANAPLDRLRWVFCSCAHYEHGFFAAYRHMAGEDVDFAVCLGDYIYEYGADGAFKNGDGPVRSFDSGETVSLVDYRNRYALYKTDADLAAAHAAMPWIVTWDDHEVDNDYANDHSEDGEPVDTFLQRRAAAYQAYYEHQPLRPDAMPSGPNARLYRRLTFGDLVEVNVLDTRQYRSPQPCGAAGPHCPDAFDPAVTLTGPEQEKWLLDGLSGSTARWNVIAQQVMMAQLDAAPAPDTQFFNHDQWDGYPAARQRILDHLRDVKVSNPIVLTGDIHSAWVADLKLDFDDETSPTVGTELIATSVTSYNPYERLLPFSLSFNPHLKFCDVRHGYTRADATPDALRTDFRALESVETPDARFETVGSFVVENGIAGAQKA